MKRYDEKILNKLLDRYENSLLYTGKNQVNITIALPIQKSVLPEYFDETSLQYDVIHEQLEVLEEKGYIRLVWKHKKRGHILEKCELVTEAADAAYVYLRRTPRTEREQKIKEICYAYRGKAKELDDFLRWVETRLSAGESVQKYANVDNPEEFDRLCGLIWRILTNTKESFLREFSVQYYHDSKLVEKEIEKAVGIILHFTHNDGLKDLEEAEVLEEFNIYKNPSWIMLKGAGSFRVENVDSEASVIHMRSVPGGIGIANGDINKIEWSREIEIHKILTIENLTTFHRWKLSGEEDSATLCIYLGGYHNRTKRQFLKNLYDVYPQAEYYHFGDIDCGGFRIWKDLCEKTGIPFRLLGMDCDTYRRYLKFGKDLTELDKKTLQRMLEDPFFEGQRELFQMMLEKGKKLEQECVEM